VSNKGRRRLIAAITVAGLVATVWSMRARLLARSEQDFEHRYGP
jgi:hypothetical protein